ncbi:MAG: oxygen-independent coproporphyrinogen III oxidase [Gammaproteobacteria bacterium RIFCSPLOWO2_02_FULL_61_13]|nr:MAG: oxygen-independent coproporphyrinogen III oxidase [Gammaproteobacteria bacterium RIFCSPLOWO2_02_FULL_61_13]
MRVNGDIKPTEPPLFDAELIRRYDVNGPRYTSYPTALQFRGDFDADAYLVCAQESNGDPIPTPLSLYMHIPFCATVCFYCACNKVVTRNRRHAAEYLHHLFLEMEMQARLFDADRTVEQLHLGGGTPTFLDADQLAQLMAQTRRLFHLAPDTEGEYAIEIDPRTLRPDSVAQLRQLGFNRVSLGVQDLDEDVQQAVNRIQPEEVTLSAVAAIRKEGFHSLAMDLIYGLPRQTPDSFARTLERIIAMRPDRLSVFNYAHLPHRFKTQQQIDESALPGAEDKLRILQLAITQLTAARYEYIGMDHFALPGDSLCQARRAGTLHRNFQGYSTRGNCDLIGLGMSSIGQIDNCYAQNARTLESYYALVSAGRLPVERGIVCSADDRLRRQVIMTLLCYFSLRPTDIERDWDVVFWDYFARERQRLEAFVTDGLLRVDDDLIEVLPRGRLLIRNICMAFDQYLRDSDQQQGFSKAL